MLRTGVVVAPVLAGCAVGLPELQGRPATAEAPGQRWTPPPDQPAPQPIESPSISPEVISRSKNWTILDIIDLALRNNPATRIAWEDARAAAAGYGSRRGQYYPTVELDLSVTESYRSTASSGSPAGQLTLFGTNLTLSYLLFDFGGRSASVESARQALISADWTQNQVIQDTILQVELACYRYLAAKALVESLQASLTEARAGLDAARTRREAGVATLSDELQARTALSRVKLGLQSAAGLVQTSRGALAAAMGLPASLDFEMPNLPQDLPAQAVTAGVEDFIQQALAKRPDLMAVQGSFLAARAHTREMRAASLPSVSFAGNLGRSYFDGFSSHGDAAAGTILLQVPLFSGLSQTYLIQQAEAEEASARERQRSLQNQIALQVFQAFVNLQTATQQVGTAAELLGNANQSAAVSLGRYQAGVGNILELLSAQAALADARTGEIQARLDWFASLAQLAHATGQLGLRGDNPLFPATSNPTGEKKP